MRAVRRPGKRLPSVLDGAGSNHLFFAAVRIRFQELKLADFRIIEAFVSNMFAVRRGSDVGIHIAGDNLRTASQSRGAVNVKDILRGAARFAEIEVVAVR